MKRAMTVEAKMARATEIMDIAGEMLITKDYRLIKMSDIAKAAGISNGLIFTYFRTKETLFLCLLWREYERRLDYLEKESEKISFNDFEDIQKMLIAELEHVLYENPVYIKLESMRKEILEKNVDSEMFRDMVRIFSRRVAAWSKKLGERGIISQAEILDIFFAEIGIIIGCYLQHSILKDVEDDLLAEGFKDLNMDFPKSVLSRMNHYLAGYKQSLDN